MKTQNYGHKIESYFRTNPGLTQAELSVLLTADLLYQDTPEDLADFYKRYAHLDPDALRQPFQGITFITIAHSDRTAAELKDRLNAYMNIKFHDIVHSKSYDENAPIFAQHSMIASSIIDEILEKSALPAPIVEALREREEVHSCHDFFEMLTQYRLAGTATVRFELLRKLGLIVLIARINRCVEFEALDDRMRQVEQALIRGLGSAGQTEREYCYWLNAEDGVEYCAEREQAEELHARHAEERRQQALDIHSPERITCHPFRTSSGIEIIHMELRNKFGSTEHPSYTSYVEKMLRKNLEFPNQVHDVIGVKIVVDTEDEIPRIITELESFLGGSSTRKQEKNSYHRFGRRGLSEYSSEEYFVWKAIYDITLPHPSIIQIEKMLEITRNNERAQVELTRRLHFFVNNPRDFVIEVQLQDIKSYLLSITTGSPTEHAWLKMNQIRSNSFYKVFPKDIYEEELARLKLGLLSSGAG